MNFRVVFFGTPEFAVPSLDALVAAGCTVAAAVTQPDRPVGRHQVPTPPPVKSCALQFGIPVLQPEKVRTPEFEATMRTLEPDLLVTAAYGRILPTGVLAAARIAPLNVHASLLPRYRGASPIQRCVMDGATESGVTIMRMDEGMDTGDVLLQKAVPVPEDMDAERLEAVLARLGALALVEALDRIASGTAVFVPQDPALATTVKPLDREDGRIDWSASARRVRDLVRGTVPWPGAFTTLGGRRIKMHRARLLEAGEALDLPTLPRVASATGSAAPGTALGLLRDGLAVACGDGAVALLEVQPESGRRMSARDFGLNLPAPTRFGT